MKIILWQVLKWPRHAKTCQDYPCSAMFSESNCLIRLQSPLAVSIGRATHFLFPWTKSAAKNPETEQVSNLHGKNVWSVNFVSCNSCPGLGFSLSVSASTFLLVGYLVFPMDDSLGLWLKGPVGRLILIWSAGRFVHVAARYNMRQAMQMLQQQPRERVWTWNVLEHPGTSRSLSCLSFQCPIAEQK